MAWMSGPSNFQTVSSAGRGPGGRAAGPNCRDVVRTSGCLL